MKWEDNWEFVKELGGGGQGNTSVVQNRANGQLGVLKTLRNAKKRDAKARGRMHREAVNLEILSQTDEYLPKVLESNTADYEDKSVELYFVMEFIDGCTLDELIKRDGPMTLTATIEFVAKISHTLANGHNEGILHRDLKPKNIVVDGKKNDPHVVDYGLSFNRLTDGDLTTVAETMRNEFITLPETNVHGEDRRDSRSDITALAGIAYYLLTGFAPKHLVNSENRPPHRRTGKDLSKVVTDTVAGAQLGNVFDRAFSPDLSKRFETCNDFIVAMELVAKTASGAGDDDVELVAAQATELLRGNVRELQITALKNKAFAIKDRLAKELEIGKLNLQLFKVSISEPSVEFTLPSGYDELGRGFAITLTSNFKDLRSRRYYRIVAQGMNLTLMAGESSFAEPKSSKVTVREMHTLDDDTSAPKIKETASIVAQDYRRWLVSEIRKMQVRLLESHGAVNS